MDGRAADMQLFSHGAFMPGRAADVQPEDCPNPRSASRESRGGGLFAFRRDPL
jgi:hypothetical protein